MVNAVAVVLYAVFAIPVLLLLLCLMEGVDPRWMWPGWTPHQISGSRLGMYKR